MSELSVLGQLPWGARLSGPCQIQEILLHYWAFLVFCVCAHGVLVVVHFNISYPSVFRMTIIHFVASCWLWWLLHPDVPKGMLVATCKNVYWLGQPSFSSSQQILAFCPIVLVYVLSFQVVPLIEQFVLLYMQQSWILWHHQTTLSPWNLGKAHTCVVFSSKICQNHWRRYALKLWFNDENESLNAEFVCSNYFGKVAVNSDTEWRKQCFQTYTCKASSCVVSLICRVFQTISEKEFYCVSLCTILMDVMCVLP
jgi:hypothetical protein